MKIMRFLVLLFTLLPSTGKPQPNWEKYLLQGIQFLEKGRYAEAEAAFTAALHEAEPLGPDDPAVASILINFGGLFTKRHEYSAALLAFERSLTILKNTRDARVGLILGNMAMIYHNQNRYNTAEPLYRKAIMILEEMLGPDHPDTATAEAGLGKLFMTMHRNGEAEVLLEKSIPVLERTHKAGDANLPIVLTNLAEAYRLDGRYAKAEPLFRRVLAIVQAEAGINNEEVIRGLVDYAGTLRKTNRKAEARALQAQLKTMLPK